MHLAFGQAMNNNDRNVGFFILLSLGHYEAIKIKC